MAREIYDAMETARCEAVGARAMPGTAGNIDAKIATEAERRGYARIDTASEAPLAVAAGYLIRQLATGRPLPEGAQNVLDLWREHLEGSAAETLPALEACLADQAAFAKMARQIIDDLGYGDQLGDDPDALEDDSEEEGTEDDQEDAPDSTGEDDSQEEDAEAAPERSQEQEQDAAQAQVEMDDSDT